MENNRGRYILILKLDILIFTSEMSDWFPITLNNSGEITDEKLKEIKEFFLCRWKILSSGFLNVCDNAVKFDYSIVVTTATDNCNCITDSNTFC